MRTGSGKKIIPDKSPLLKYNPPIILVDHLYKIKSKFPIIFIYI